MTYVLKRFNYGDRERAATDDPMRFLAAAEENRGTYLSPKENEKELYSEALRLHVCSYYLKKFYETTEGQSITVDKGKFSF